MIDCMFERAANTFSAKSGLIATFVNDVCTINVFEWCTSYLKGVWLPILEIGNLLRCGVNVVSSFLFLFV